MPTITTQFATTVIEGTGARLEVDFDQVADDTVQVRYRLHNVSSADMAVFDRGDRRSVEDGVLEHGRVAPPLFRDDGDDDYTFGHVALAAAQQPAGEDLLVPLAVRVPAGTMLEGGFELRTPDAMPRRVRWCLGMAPLDRDAFDGPQPAQGGEVWQAPTDIASRQQKLCTPWYDMAAGVFAED